MKQTKFLLLTAATLTATLFAQAQTADEIIAKHVAAIGGKEKLAGINSIHMESTMNVMGNESASTTVILNGKGFKTEAEMMGSKMVQVVTDKGGWAINPMGGGSAEPMPEDQYKASKDQLDIAGPFVDYNTKGNKVELAGQEKVGEVNAYKLKLTNKDGVQTTVFIDPATYYIIQTVRTANIMGQDMEITTTLSDYKPTSYGFVVPHATETNFGGQFSFTAKVNKVEVNKPVDPAIFEMPK